MEEQEKSIPAPKLRARLLAMSSVSAHPGQDILQQIFRIRNDKQTRALAVWAEKRMGASYPRWLIPAEKLFWFYYFLLMAVEKCDPLTAAKKAPFVIRNRPQRKSLSIDVHVLLSEYDLRKTSKIFEKIVQIKKKKKRKWRNLSAHEMAFKEALPGISEQKITRYISSNMEPSDIFLDYLCYKYKLPIAGEALKKSLRSARNDE